MKDTTKRVTVYLNEENCDYLEEKKEKKGTSYSDTVNAALVNYRNSKVQKKAEELVKPTEDKLSQLLYNQVYMMQALGALYRTGNYATYLNAESIGSNFYCLQLVTLGNDSQQRRPVIGDNVRIFTGATVFGGITIGNNVTIGAGCVVHRSVPDGCTVVGNPAFIVRRNGQRVNEQL